MGEDDWDDEWDDGAQQKESDDFDLEGLLESAGEPAAEPPKAAGRKPKIGKEELEDILGAAEPAPGAPNVAEDDDFFDADEPTPVHC